MKQFKNIMIFGMIPVLILVLLWVNANLQSQKYEKQVADLKQYDAEIKAEIEGIDATVAEEVVIPVKIKNLGTMAWVIDDDGSISLSYHILNKDKTELLHDGLRTKLVESVRSGEATDLDAVVQAPDQPGTYYIVFDMVHEGVTWFAEKGSKTLEIELEVK